MSTFSDNKEFWREFIDIYRDLPALWKVKSDCYRNRTLKDEGYKILVEKLRVINPDADREMAKKKINALRTNYRRELKKVKESQHSGAGSDAVYVPTLWYFDDIDFLKDQETPISSTSSIDYTSEEDDTKITEIIQEPSTPVKRPAPLSHETPNRKVKVTNKNELLSLAAQHLRSNNDYAEILGRTWALEYSQLKPDQQLFAKKAINDVLFEGRLGTLSRYSVVINGSQTSAPNSNFTNGR